MSTKLVNKSETYSEGYGAGDGTTERLEYECHVAKD